MTGFAKRIEGLLFVSIGLLLFFVVIPRNTETMDYGWLQPDTVPNIMAITLFLSGVWLTMFPPGQLDKEDPRQMMRVALYIGVVGVGIYAISVFGFLYVAPFLALVIMLLIGERRLFWMLIGVGGVPALIWLAVEILLNRPLPG